MNHIHAFLTTNAPTIKLTFSFGQLQRLRPTTSNPGVGINKVLNIKISETIGAIEGVGLSINVLKLGVWCRARPTSKSVLSDVEIVGDMLSSHWDRWRDERCRVIGCEWRFSKLMGTIGSNGPHYILSFGPTTLLPQTPTTHTRSFVSDPLIQDLCHVCIGADS